MLQKHYINIHHMYYVYVMVQGGWVLPDPYLLTSLSTEKVVVLVIRYSS